MSCFVNVGFGGDRSMCLRNVILLGLSLAATMAQLVTSFVVWQSVGWAEPLLAIVLSWLGPMSQK